MNKTTLPFDLVVLDLDGTILDLYHARTITPRVRQAIAAVQAAGIPVTIGTGRTLDYICDQLGYLQLTHPVITMQGAVIGDPVTNKILAETDISLELAQQVADWVDASTYVTSFYFHDERGRVRIYQNRPAETPSDQAFHDHVFGGSRLMQPSFRELLAEPTAKPPLKFLLDNDLNRTANVLPELQARFGADLYITRTHPRLVEGTAQGIDKGQGLLHLCDLLGLTPERVLVIGDNDNDIPMLRLAGYSVAMGNATTGAKAVAKWIAPTVEEDGAAVALERLILGKK